MRIHSEQIVRTAIRGHVKCNQSDEMTNKLADVGMMKSYPQQKLPELISHLSDDVSDGVSSETKDNSSKTLFDAEKSRADANRLTVYEEMR